MGEKKERNGKEWLKGRKQKEIFSKGSKD